MNTDSRLIVAQDEKISHRFGSPEFDCDYWQATPAFQRLAGGRGGSCRVKIDNIDCVLRQYLRGGMIAPLLGDRYLWLGQRNSRPEIEKRALEEAQSNGLPVPQFVAYRLVKKGMFYRAAIMSRFIPHVATLGGLLKSQALDPAAWSSLGRLIRRMHDAGINHADLNANNILLDAQGGFHLIDFDKARIGQPPGPWQQANVSRLKRSLEKLKRLEEGSYFDEGQWRALVSGYRF